MGKKGRELVRKKGIGAERSGRLARRKPGQHDRDFCTGGRALGVQGVAARASDNPLLHSPGYGVTDGSGVGYAGPVPDVVEGEEREQLR